MAASVEIITRIPAEIHMRAGKLGLFVEIYHEVIAGHGATGKVAWAISTTKEFQGFTDSIRMAFGSAKDQNSAHNAIRCELYALEENHV